MLGAHQLKASLTKNYIEKKRNTRATCCEYFSHFIILLLLVYGYFLSDVLDYEDETYASIQLSIPLGARSTEASEISSQGDSSILTEVLELLEGPLPIPNFDSFILASRGVSRALEETDELSDILSRTEFGRRYGNLLTLGDLHFAPAGEEVDSLVNYLKNETLTFSSLTYHIHRSESAAVKYILNNLDEYALALIVLHQVTPEKINYEIRQNYTTLPNTNEVVNWITTGLDTKYQTYYLSGFLSLQDVIDRWAFSYINATEETSGRAQCEYPGVIYTMPFPTAAYDQNLFFTAVGFLLGLAMTMATMYPVSRLVKSVVEEKELKMREVMKIMGLRDWVHQLSWFITAFILFFWITVTTTLICSATFLPASDLSILFTFFFLFFMSLINFSFLIASFFSHAKLAAIVGPIALFSAMLPRFIFFTTNRYEQQASKYAASLLSPTAFSFGADILADYEYSGVGVQWYNINDGYYNFAGCLRLLFVDFFLYGFLAWYFDQPGYAA